MAYVIFEFCTNYLPVIRFYVITDYRINYVSYVFYNRKCICHTVMLRFSSISVVLRLNRVKYVFSAYIVIVDSCGNIVHNSFQFW